jgi:hypothetical protein
VGCTSHSCSTGLADAQQHVGWPSKAGPAQTCIKQQPAASRHCASTDPYHTVASSTSQYNACQPKHNKITSIMLAKLSFT